MSAGVPPADDPAADLAELIGRRVRVTAGYNLKVHEGRLLSYVVVATVGLSVRIEHDNGAHSTCEPVVLMDHPPTCPLPYEGDSWHAEPCERAPQHVGFHCDRYGRTW